MNSRHAPVPDTDVSTGWEALEAAAFDHHPRINGEWSGPVMVLLRLLNPGRPAHLAALTRMDLDTRIEWVRCDRLVNHLAAHASAGLAVMEGLACDVVADYPGPTGPAAYTAGVTAHEHTALLAAAGETETLTRLRVLAALT